MTQTQVERLFIKDRTSLSATMFRLTTDIDITGPANTTITSNLEVHDAPAGFGALGTAMSQSSGLFTFPSTGIYLIQAHLSYSRRNTNSEYNGGRIITTTDNNSSSSVATLGYGYVPDLAGAYTDVTLSHIFDVTDTSTHKVLFNYDVYDDVQLAGNTGNNRTFFMFIKLGNT